MQAHSDPKRQNDPPRITVAAYSGNARPWRARVYLGDRLVALSGFCSTAERAREAAIAAYERLNADGAE